MLTNLETTIETQMLIRKPAAVVFDAFVDPQSTVNFWFSKSSGPLVMGQTVTWQWETYGISVSIVVKEIIPNQKIVINWGKPQTTVVFEFEAITTNTTYVTIKNHISDVDNTSFIKNIIDQTGGFTTVLDGAKAYLEHGINLNLNADKFANKKH